MYNPFQDATIDMSPSDFEKYALHILTDRTSGLESLKIYHNKCVEAYDGNYQLDGFIEFEVMGVAYKTIIECKHYKRPISREIVQKLYDNLRAIGAQKGILISSSNFQSGAMQYAKEHGIALIQLTEAGEDYFSGHQFNVIMMHGYTPYNGGLPYIGVLLKPSGAGSTGCGYLKKDSDDLTLFLKSN